MKMLQELCFYAVLHIVFAVSIDAFHGGVLVSTTTTTRGFHQAPILLGTNRGMARQAVYCLSKVKLQSHNTDVGKSYNVSKDGEDDTLIFVSNVFKAGKAIVAADIPVPAVVAVFLVINLLLWNKIDNVNDNINDKLRNVNSQIESSNKNVNDNINKRFEKIAMRVECRPQNVYSQTHGHWEKL